MKKLFLALIAIAALASLSACGGNPGDNDGTDTGTSTTATTSEAATSAPEESGTPEPDATEESTTGETETTTPAETTPAETTTAASETEATTAQTTAATTERTPDYDVTTVSNATYKYSLNLPSSWQDQTSTMEAMLGDDAAADGAIAMFSDRSADGVGNNMSIVVSSTEPNFDDFSDSELNAIMEEAFAAAGFSSYDIVDISRTTVSGKSAIKSVIDVSVGSGDYILSMRQTQYIINGGDYSYVITFSDLNENLDSIIEDIISSVVIG